LDEPRTAAQPSEAGYAREWRDFVNLNSGAMFQIALLLSGSAALAEQAIIASLDDIDVSMPPGSNDLTLWQSAVIARTIKNEAWKAAADVTAFSMLQPGLWPVLRIRGRSRIWFVLRMLLNYSATECVQTLAIDESEMPALVNEAIDQVLSSQIL
jgi:hypothetical protein